MDEYPTALLDRVFSAVSDPTRRAILARLAAGEASVTDLARPFAMSQPAISKHLRVLERADTAARSHAARVQSSRRHGWSARSARPIVRQHAMAQ